MEEYMLGWAFDMDKATFSVYNQNCYLKISYRDAFNKQKIVIHNYRKKSLTILIQDCHAILTLSPDLVLLTFYCCIVLHLYL